MERGVAKALEVRRMGFAFTACPTTPTLEKEFYPDAGKIASKAYEIVSPETEIWVPTTHLHMEEIEFKGPF
jgi:pyruvate dehydrogenase E1 component beta subunit